MNYSNTHLSKNRSTKANTITDISGKNKTNLLKRTTLASALALVLGVSTYANAAEAAAAAVPPAATPAASVEKTKSETKVTPKETLVTIPGLEESTSTVGIDAHGQITVNKKPVTNVTIKFGSDIKTKVDVSGDSGDIEAPKNATITLANTSSSSSPDTITFNAPVNLGSDGTITLQLPANTVSSTQKKSISLTFKPQTGIAGTENTDKTPTVYTGNINVGGAGATINFEGNVKGNLVASTEGANPVNYNFKGNSSLNGLVATSSDGGDNGNVANVLSFDDSGTTNSITDINTEIATVTAVYAKAQSNKERTLNIGNVNVTGNQGQNTILISTEDLTGSNNSAKINLTQNQNGADELPGSTALQTSIPVTTKLAGILNLENTTATSSAPSGKQGRATNFFAAKTINVTGTVINNPTPDGKAHRTRQIFLTKDLNIANDVQGNGGQVVFDFVGQNNKIQHLSIASGQTTINNVATEELTSTGQQLYTTSLDLGTLTLKALPKDHNATQTLDIKFATNGATDGQSQQITATLSGNIDNQGAKLTLDSSSAPYPSDVKFSNEHLAKASQLYLQLVDGTTISANGTDAKNTITLANQHDSLKAVSKQDTDATADAETVPTAIFLAENNGTNTINVKGTDVKLSNLVFTGDGDGKNIISLGNNVNTLTANSVVTKSGQTEINSQSSTLTFADAVKTIGEDAKTTISLPALPTTASQHEGTLTLSEGAETSGSGSETAFIFTKKAGDTGTEETKYTLTATQAITAKDGAKNIFVLGNGGNPAPDTLALTGKVIAEGQGSANSFDLVNGNANITGFANVEATDGATTVFNFNGGNTQTLNIDKRPQGNVNVDLNNVTVAVLKDPTKFEPTADKTTTITFNKDNQSLKFGGANGSSGLGVVATTDGTFRSTGKTIFNFAEGVGTATIVGNITTTPAPVAAASAAPAAAAAAPAPAAATAAATTVVPTTTTTSAAAQPAAGSVDFNINSSNSDNQFILNFVKDTSVSDSNSASFPEGTIPVDNNVSYNLNQKGVSFTLNDGGTDPFAPATVKSGTFNFNADATLTNDFAPKAGHSITFNLNGNTATLVGHNISVTNLDATSGAVVDLSKNDDEDSDTARSNFRLLTIGNAPTPAQDGSVTYGQTGLVAKDLTFKIFVNTQPEEPTLGGYETTDGDNYTNHAYSDRIVVKDGKPGNYVLVLPDENNLSVLKDVKYVKGTGTETEGNLAVATVRTGTGIGFVVPDDVVDGEVLKATINKQNTDENGNASANGDYVTYFLSRASNLGLDSEFQNVYTSALQLNYDTYLANFNSLNKRLGELRTYPQAEGAWARIFGGSESNDTNAGLRTTYKTLQAGYDKLTTLLGKQSHAGVAVSYGLATSKSYLQGTGANVAQLAGASSKALEFAVYNSYVPATGLYSDTIAKLSLVHSKFDVNRVNASNTARTKNYALTLSQELGYLINLDEAQHWSLTPSYELGLGYVGKSNFSQQVGGSVHTVSKDASTVLRNKLGAVLTYNFDPTKPGSVYLGAFYEHDNFLGGKVHFDTVSNISNPSSTTKQGLRSDGRAVLNFGLNSSLSKNIGLYLDVQKSFGGKINTDFQLNSGVRVNF